MATNALKYIKNVGKSVTYASIASLKEYNPVFTSLIEDNKDSVTNMYRTVRDLKKNTKKLPEMFDDSEFGQYSKKLLTNLKSDLKTGKFYNKDRMNESSGFGDFDDFGFDDEFGGSDEGFGSFDEDEFNDSDNMMNIVGERASNAVSSAVTRSAEYIAETQNENRKATTKQLSVMYSGLHSGMSTINDNIARILEFSTNHTATHYENSRTFYTEITRLDNERNAYLKEISENLKAMNQPVKRDPKYRKNTYSDITSYEGALNLDSYMQNIKKNISNSVGGYTDIFKMMIENNMFVDSPLETIMTMMISSMVPLSIQNSMETFNKSIGGLAANALMGLKNKARTKGGIWDTLNDIFGVNTSLDTKIDTSKYEKGRVPFDGITRKAIVEVIPTYLAKILATLNGKPESRFDYETGKFISTDEIQKQFDSMRKTGSSRAAWDLNRVVDDRKSKLSFRSDDEKRQFEDDWEAIKEYMFKNQKSFNTRDKSLTGKSFGLKGGVASDVNVRLLQEILDGRSEVMHYANAMYREVDEHNRKMARIGDSSVMTALANNSMPQAASAGTPETRSIITAANNDVISELVAIHKELSYIRIYGTGGHGGSGTGSSPVEPGPHGGGGSRPKFENFNIPTMRTSNDNAYNIKQEQSENRASSNVESIDISDRVSEIIGDAKFDATQPSKNATKSFSQKMHEAAGLSAKMSVLVESATELSKKPAKFIIAMMDKADNRLYDLIYGTKEDKKGKKSFAGRMFKGLENMFDNFSYFLEKNIFEPLKKTFNKDNLHNMVKGFFNTFGVDIDQKVNEFKDKLFGAKDENGDRQGGTLGGIRDGFRNFASSYKDNMRSAGNWFKGTVNGAKDWMTQDKYYRDNEKNKDLDERIKRMKDLASRAASDMTEASTGIRRVDQTGLAVISEGEMVIPPDMNPFNIAKRQRNEKKVKRDLISGINSISEFAKGTDDAKILYGSKEADNAIIEILKRNPELADKLIAKYESSKDKTSITDLILDEYAKLIGNVRNAADNFGMDDKQTKSFKEKALKMIGDVKEYGSTMATGATIGAGVSVFTGLIGGPLVGAAIGAGAGLLSKSESLQKMLFGEIGEDGERKDGLIPKHITDNIKKYLPDMGKGATIGSILAAMPLVPGGPLAGLLIGSGIGFAKNNAKVQNLLFGDEGQGLLGMTKEDFGKKVRSVLPKMGAGALAGLVAGPFGLGTNLLLGSAIGFASDTNTFKETVFGKIKNGKLEGGLFGEFKTFLNEDILDPLRRAKDPFIEQFKIMGETVTDALKNVFKESFGDPIKDWFKEKLFKPLNGMLKGVLGGLAKPLKSIISAPFQAIGMAGDSLRARQIKSGRAVNYMQSAQERNAFRRNRGKLLMGGGDRYRSIDESLENITNVDDLAQIKEGLTAITQSRTDIDTLTDTSVNNIQRQLRDSKVNRDIRDEAVRLIRAGQYKEAQEYIQKSNIDDSKKENILKLVNEEASKLQLAKKYRKDSKGTANELVEQMRSKGFNISDGMVKKLALGGKDAQAVLKLVESEYNLKKPQELVSTDSDEDKSADEVNTLNKDQATRHTEIKDEFNKAIDLLKEISENLKRENIGKHLPTELENLSRVDQFADEVSDIYDENGLIKGTTKTGKKVIKTALKYTNRKASQSAKFVRGKVKEAGTEVGKHVKSASEKVNEAYQDVRNSDIANEWLGNKKEKNWGPKYKPVVVSEGEYIAKDEVKDAETAGDGKVNKGNAWSLFNIWNETSSGVRKIAGLLSAIAFKDGIDISKIDDKSDTKSFLSKIKNKFQKGFNTVTQFVDGLPIKMIKDKNGNEIPDPSSADNDNNLKIINEKHETQKGILASLTNMPNMFGNLFSNLFGEKEDKEEKSIFEKIFDFFTGDGDNANGKLTFFGVIKKVLPFLATLLPIAGLTGALDDITAKLGIGFGEKDSNDKKYIDGKEVQLDENGNPVKDENGNYVSTAGEILSGKLQTNISLDNMSLSDRLKYNAVRGTVTGKGSIIGSNKITKAITNSKPAQFVKKLATGIDAASLDSIYTLVTDAVTKWKNAVKHVPLVSKYADKFDDLGLAIMGLVEDYLPKMSKSLSSVTKSFAKLAWPILIATTVIDFTTGWQDASNILKIKAEHVTLPQKIICGLVRTIKNYIPVIGTFIPDSLVTDLFINHVSGWFGIDVSKIKKQQSEAQEALDIHNQTYNTNLSWAEYNKLENNEYTWTEKIGNTVSSVAANIKSKFSVSDTSKTKATQAVTSVPTYVGSGSGLVGRGSSDDTFVSQVDPKYKNKVFNTSGDTKVQTLGNTGCAPAAAAMAINASMGSNVESMENTSKLALKYKVKDDGVSADYFEDQFARHGIGAKYIESDGSTSGSAQIMKELMNRNKVVLMGQDGSNMSKSTSPFGANPHYVVATGLSEDGKYIYINDPESNTPNIRYEASKILKSSSLGIAAKVANGTKKVAGKLRRYIGGSSYGSESIQYKVWNSLRAAGYNEIATAAAMGNIEAESAFKPNMIEKGSGVGFGLIQWSYGRRTALEREATNRGVNPADLGFQIEYLLKELQPNSGQWTKASSSYGLGSFSRSDWADGKDISDATKAFMCCFERPAYDPAINHIDRRLEAAAKYYEAFTGKAIDTNLNLSYSSSLSTTNYGDTTGGTDQPKSKFKGINMINDILGIFSGLASKFGFNIGGSNDSSSIGGSDYSGSSYDANGNPTDTVSTASGNVSANPQFAQLQKALVDKMYSVQGKLKYAQNNEKYPGSRNPEHGSGDCSSTVQWAYKNILGVDPGDWTGAQRDNPNTFTVATSTRDESKLQLGDLLLKDGHVEMYAGNGQMIGHGSGYGPRIKPLDQTGKYDLVRRWKGFQDNSAKYGGYETMSGAGSGLKPAYSTALKYVETNKDYSKSNDLPFSINMEELENNKSSAIEYNSKKVATSGTKKYVGRATEIPATPSTVTTKSDSKDNDLRTLVSAMVRLLTQVVTNTDQLNNIAKLLGEYLVATSHVGKGTELKGPAASASKKTLNQDQKNTAILAKQNLINALQSANTGSSSAQLLRLIEATEKIARE